MGYNHAHAFQETPTYTNAYLKQIALAALIRYKRDFPEAGVVQLQMWPKSKNVEMTGVDSVFYTWKELGF